MSAEGPTGFTSPKKGKSLGRQFVWKEKWARQGREEGLGGGQCGWASPPGSGGRGGRHGKGSAPHGEVKKRTDHEEGDRIRTATGKKKNKAGGKTKKKKEAAQKGSNVKCKNKRHVFSQENGRKRFTRRRPRKKKTLRKGNVRQKESSSAGEGRNLRGGKEKTKTRNGPGWDASRTAENESPKGEVGGATDPKKGAGLEKLLQQQKRCPTQEIIGGGRATGEGEKRLGGQIFPPEKNGVLHKGKREP